MLRMPLCVLLSTLVATSLVDETALGDDAYYPRTNTWETITPEAAGADQTQLDRALSFAGEKHSKGVVILYGGRILAERYWDGWNQDMPHPAYSASKSFISTLVGIAIEEKKINSLEQPVAEILQEWKGKRSYEKITVRHLLSMSSGLEGGKRNFLGGLMALDERKFATSLPIESPPGTVWEYHNSAYRLCFPLLEEATGETLQDYTQEKLLQPLGMTHSKWRAKRFRAGQYTFLETTPRDAARFGLCVLRQGKWHDEQVVSQDWIKRATTAANPKVHPSYGYLWWLNGGAYHYRPLRSKQQGPIFPGCPNDAFAAIGKDSQVIYIVPSLNLVVTRFGDAPDERAPALSEFVAKFLGLVCKSLQPVGQ